MNATEPVITDCHFVTDVDDDDDDDQPKEMLYRLAKS